MGKPIDARMEKVRKLQEINCTPEEKMVLKQIFNSIDTTFYHSEMTDQKDKTETLFKARYEIEAIVTAIGINKMVEDMIEREQKINEVGLFQSC